MPYIRKNKCVYKKDGTKVGCSTSSNKAKKYLKALYANEQFTSYINYILEKIK